MEKNLSWWLVKSDRVAAWVLLATILLFFISGYGMTKGLIDTELAYSLHEDILPPVVLIAFSIHTFLAMRLALMRWRRWNKISAGSLAFIYLGFFVVLVYAGYFYEPAPATTRGSGSANAVQPAAAPAQNSETQTAAQNGTTETATVFTAETLAKYNGKNGNASYIAIDGKVYDVSTLFVNGTHHGCTAGREVSAGFWAVKKHLKSMLADYPVVGIYKAN